ncbi:tetratricopeptide repeat protein 28-like [Acropora millepora]|uniref:tetratricopeptide repeat protein 28-like n=1 Tax=Acropora millepora TaxID=45264 RepID=UPI001CF543FB|nr:tetratricopeptide repeat protein 28-like [Acropora millepora]
MGDQAEKGRNFGSRRLDLHLPGDLQTREFLEKHGCLGNVYILHDDFRKVIEQYEKHLKIAIEISDRAGEGRAYAKLGNAYYFVGDFRKAIEYYEKYLKIAKEIGNRPGEGRAYASLGNAYHSLGDFRKVIEYHEKNLKIAQEIGNRAREGKVYANLGNAYHSLGDFQKAIEYHEKHLKIAIEIGDRAGEGRAYGNLGNAYHSLGDFRKAIDYHEKHLKIAKESGDRAGEGRACGNLGVNFNSLGDFRKAIEYHENDMKIAMEIDDQAGKGRAFGNLGNAYYSLGDFRKAIEYHEKHLKIAKEIGDRAGEGAAYGNLGICYNSLGDFRKAIDYHKKHLKIAKESGDRRGEGRAYGNLGQDYNSLGEFRKAIEYHEKHLKIAIEIGDRAGEGGTYGFLGNAYHSLGDFRKAIEYHEKHLKIAKEIGDLAGEGRAYGNLGNAYNSLGEFRKAIEYHEKDLKIAIEIGDRAGEGGTYGNLGNAYHSLGDFREAIEYHEKHLKIAKEIGDRAGEGGTYGNLGNTYHSLGYFREAIEYHEKHLKIAIAIGDRAGEGIAYGTLGITYFNLGQFDIAVDNFVSAVDVFNTLRSLLKSEDNWKIKFRELHETTYTFLWRSLLRIGKINEALFAADQGRAQTLYDNLMIRYGLASPLSYATFDSKETTIRLFTELSSQIIFLGLEGLKINIWFLTRGQKVAFRQGTLEADITEKDPIRALLQAALRKIGAEVEVRCEDRTFDEFDSECSSNSEVCEEVEKPCQSSDNPFRPFYDAVIGPIVDLLESQYDELVVVSDGALCFTPWAAIVESIRIRTVPSLTSYQLISSVPDGRYKTGALLVGNPCLKQLKKPPLDLPYAQEEVEMIASILNTRPLTGREATKAEVIRQMSSVGLIHIAAHGNKHTGEICLSPNPGWTSKFPQKKDFILKMSDVLAANLRARLVVLSCCHSGRGRILKGEGVVGIARAFLASGARSVLISLWAIDDETTMMFMKSFYQHLKEGKTASVAVHQAMNSLRESKKFSEMRYWAPFQLLGDDVKIEVEADDVVKN